MTSSLKMALCEYLGELMYYKGQTHDWIASEEITEKINAVNVLLDLDTQEPSWFEKVADFRHVPDNQ